MRRALVFMLLAVSSCGYQATGRAMNPGIYSCAKPGSSSTYLLDTEAETTLFWRGDGGGLSFVDISTGQKVRLREADGFRCKKVQA